MLRGAVSDKENRGYVELLKSLFPEQTKTLPRIIVWSLVFLIDLMVVAFAGFSLGFDYSKWLIALVFLCTVLLFWVQGHLWGIFMKLFR